MKDGATGLLNCATLRALRLLENADNQNVLEIAPGVALVKETVGSGQRKIRSMELPQDSKGKAEKLMGVLVENAADFVSSRSLKIKIPTGATQSLARSLDEGTSLNHMIKVFNLGKDVIVKAITITSIDLSLIACLSLYKRTKGSWVRMPCSSRTFFHVYNAKFLFISS